MGRRMTVFYGRKLSREVEIELGQRYRVEPMNPRAMKHRGRVGTLVKLKDDKASYDPGPTVPHEFEPYLSSSGWLFFEDTRRYGVVCLGDLVAV